MKRFNLSTYYYTDKRISYTAHILLALAAIVLSLFNYSSFATQGERLQEAQTNLSRVKDDISLLRKDFSKYSVTKGSGAKETEKIIKRVKGINAILEKKSFSWSELLYSLEKASPKDVSIERIKPSYKTKKVRISGVAKGIEDVAEFINNLDGSDYIKKSFLLSESTKLVNKKYPAIAFEIDAEGDF